MRVAGEDHVEAGDPARQLAVDVEAVMRQQDDELRAFRAHRVDIGLNLLLADAERPVGHHPARIGDRRVGEGLADHGDLDPAALEDAIGLEDRLVPFGVADIAAEEGIGKSLDQFLDALRAIGELPMAGHGVRRQRVHDLDHVHAAGLQRGIAALPGVAAVEEQHPVLALGTDRLEHGGDAVDTAHPAIGARQGIEIDRRQRIGFRRARLQIVELEEILAGHMRRQALYLADAQIGRRLAEVDRHQLGVDVRQVHQRDVAERPERQEVVLAQALLGRQPRPLAEAGTAGQGTGGHRRHQELTPGNHARSSTPGRSSPSPVNGQSDAVAPQGRERNTSVFVNDRGDPCRPGSGRA